MPGLLEWEDIMGFRQVTRKRPVLRSGVSAALVPCARAEGVPAGARGVLPERINNAVRLALLRLTSSADSPSYRPAADYNLASSSPRVSWGHFIRLTIAHAERP